VARSSDAVVAISPDFVSVLAEDFGVPRARIHVIENWAPLEEISPRPKSNSWSRAHGFADRDVVLYSGTLGMKHDPELILSLAGALRHRSGTEVVVASEGPEAQWISEQAGARGLTHLRVIGFQPYETYPDLLGAADVLLAILEPDAGVFSVPSKMLSYVCAGRAIVLSAPQENLASRIIRQAEAGIFIRPGEREDLTVAVKSLLADPVIRSRMGAAGRAWAERHFCVETIADRFETVLSGAVASAIDRSYNPVFPDPTVRIAQNEGVY
jgi:glycosyltransferase involved in cell wall biosynthesis